MTSSLNTPSPSEIPSKSTTPKLAYRHGPLLADAQLPNCGQPGSNRAVVYWNNFRIGHQSAASPHLSWWLLFGKVAHPLDLLDLTRVALTSRSRVPNISARPWMSPIDWTEHFALPHPRQARRRRHGRSVLRPGLEARPRGRPQISASGRGGQSSSP